MKLTRAKFNEMIPDEIDALYEEWFIRFPKGHISEKYDGLNQLGVI